MVLLTLFRGGEYGFSNLGVGAALRNVCEIQGQNNVTLLQGSEMTADFMYIMFQVKNIVRITMV